MYRTTLIGGFHCRHVGGQKKRKFADIISIKMAGNSKRRKILLLLSTNMGTMTSHENHQFMNGSWYAYLASPADFTGADDIITNSAKEREPGIEISNALPNL